MKKLVAANDTREEIWIAIGEKGRFLRTLNKEVRLELLTELFEKLKQDIADSKLKPVVESAVVKIADELVELSEWRSYKLLGDKLLALSEFKDSQVVLGLIKSFNLVTVNNLSQNAEICPWVSFFSQCADVKALTAVGIELGNRILKRHDLSGYEHLLEVLLRTKSGTGERLLKVLFPDPKDAKGAESPPHSKMKCALVNLTCEATIMFGLLQFVRVATFKGWANWAHWSLEVGVLFFSFGSSLLSLNALKGMMKDNLKAGFDRHVQRIVSEPHPKPAVSRFSEFLAGRRQQIKQESTTT